MQARIIDGKTISADLRGKVTDAVHRLLRDRGIVPGLAVVLVGHNPASRTYVRNKTKAVAEAGLQSFDQHLPEEASEADLLDLIARLNADPKINGILVQLPLPPQINVDKIIAAIDPDKDVDGFHPLNAGRLASGLPGLVPCTPLGCVRLAKTVHAVARRAGGGGDRPLQHRRQAGGAVAAGRERNGDHRPFQDARFAGGVRAARTYLSPRWAALKWCAAAGSSRAPPSSTSASTAS